LREINDNSEAKRDAALSALLTTRSVRAAARKCKLSEATLFRFLQEPTFKAQYRAARRELVETATAKLQAECTSSVTVLSQIARDKKAPPASRVAAARIIIEQSIKAVELMDLAERLERLEEVLKKGGKR
jgi:DNA-binding MurR/RpiR family transcriptional regulator